MCTLYHSCDGARTGCVSRQCSLLCQPGAHVTWREAWHATLDMPMSPFSPEGTEGPWALMVQQVPASEKEIVCSPLRWGHAGLLHWGPAQTASAEGPHTVLPRDGGHASQASIPHLQNCPSGRSASPTALRVCVPSCVPPQMTPQVLPHAEPELWHQQRPASQKSSPASVSGDGHVLITDHPKLPATTRPTFSSGRCKTS